MSSEGSDIELTSALPRKQTKKMPKSPSEDLLNKAESKKMTKVKKPAENSEEKKLTTKLMIYQALTELNTRKGVSFQAIKKFLTERYNVDTEKLSYIIKKTLKKSVLDGTVTQVKGIGASGSFKLVPVKEKKKPKPKKAKIEKENKEKTKTLDKKKNVKETTKKSSEKAVKKPKEKSSGEKPNKIKKMDKEKEVKNVKIMKEDTKKVKIVKVMKTPSKKKAAMMKRKSIGSIIKPPKMRPAKVKP